MTDSLDRNAVGKRAGIIGIIVNLILATGKLIIGILSFSVSIIADALNNFTDGISSVVTMLGFKLAQKPADSEHPYGHARFEYVAGLIVSITVVFVGFELAKSSVEKIISPEGINFSTLSIILLGVAILGKIGLALYNYHAGNKINSDTLRATAVDSRNDAIMTTLVLASMLVEKFTGLTLDAYVGLLVSIFILYSGVMLTKETVSPILGNRNSEELKKAILDKIKEYPIVIGYHDLMIHDYGPGTAFCSIHFEIDKNLDPLYVHELIDKFEREFLGMGINLTVHYDPVVTDSEELNKLKHAVTSALIEIDNTLSIHDFRSIPCDGFTKVFFDLPLKQELSNQKTAIIDKVNNAMNNCNCGKYQAEITFDSTNFN